jgi:hypothetical protein
MMSMSDWALGAIAMALSLMAMFLAVFSARRTNRYDMAARLLTNIHELEQTVQTLQRRMTTIEAEKVKLVTMLVDEKIQSRTP